MSIGKLFGLLLINFITNILFSLHHSLMEIKFLEEMKDDYYIRKTRNYDIEIDFGLLVFVIYNLLTEMIVLRGLIYAIFFSRTKTGFWGGIKLYFIISVIIKTLLDIYFYSGKLGGHVLD